MISYDFMDESESLKDAWEATCLDFSPIAGDWRHWHRFRGAGFDHSALWSIGLVRALRGCSMQRCLHSMH